MTNCRNCEHDNPDDYDEYCSPCIGNNQINWEEVDETDNL